MRSRRPLVALVLAALPAAGALSGCGLGAGATSGKAAVVVQRDFGAVRVGRVVREVKDSDTAMRALQRDFAVKTRYGAGFVQSIDGLAGGRRRGRPVDWFYYVNGLEAPKGAASTRVRGGDTVVWDFHDWGGAERSPAIVGSFPEPFRHGIAGKRRPLRIECADAAVAACREVERRLGDQGIPTARSAVGTQVSQQVFRLVVGTWHDVRDADGASLLAQGPRISGIFARPAGDRMALLDPTGRVVRTLGPGGGIVAATKAPNQQATWLVIGTDEAGTLRAARALDPARLAGAFALAAGPGGDAKLPLESAR